MKKVYIETYGCQMNAADSEVVGAIVKKEGYELTDDVYEADIIFVNTCSIRENAEQRVKKRLVEFDSLRKKKPWLKVGVLGCMAERLQTLLVEECKVNLVVGPDSYRDIPSLLLQAEVHKFLRLMEQLQLQEKPCGSLCHSLQQLLCNQKYLCLQTGFC